MAISNRASRKGRERPRVFGSFPNRNSLGAWLSSDAILESHVRKAIADATGQERKLRAEVSALTQAPPEVLAQAKDPAILQMYSAHRTKAAEEVSALARIQALLLTAIYIEGVVNAWGVVSVGEDFFRQHLERAAIATKVALILALTGHGRIPTDHQSQVLLRRLFERRNQLVHRKTKEMRGSLREELQRLPNTESDLALCEATLDAFQELIESTAPRVTLATDGHGADS